MNFYKMRFLGSGGTAVFPNGMGATWQWYRRGRFVYRVVEDINCQWTRIERAVVAPTATDTEAMGIKHTHTLRRGKWERW